MSGAGLCGTFAASNSGVWEALGTWAVGIGAGFLSILLLRLQRRSLYGESDRDAFAQLLEIARSFMTFEGRVLHPAGASTGEARWVEIKALQRRIGMTASASMRRDVQSLVDALGVIFVPKSRKGEPQTMGDVVLHLGNCFDQVRTRVRREVYGQSRLATFRDHRGRDYVQALLDDPGMKTGEGVPEP